MNLHRFWFQFASPEPGDSFRLGCGVTARDHADAMAIMKETLFAGRDFPPLATFIKDVDVRTLNQQHVVPNMEPPNERGVWFPRGFTFN